MGTSSHLATLLDQERIEIIANQMIASRITPDAWLGQHPWKKTGATVAAELGGRYLLRYLAPAQVGQFTTGSNARHWVTPTPYAPQETISWLALPNPAAPRSHVMLLDPSKISDIWGPRWVRLGRGIEYILPFGFPAQALVFPWEIAVT